MHRRPLDRRTIYRYLKACEPVEVDVTLLSVADRLATRGDNAEPAIAAHLELAREILGAALAWRAEGRPRAAGPRRRAGRRRWGSRRDRGWASCSRRSTEAAYAGEIGTRDEAIALARRVLEEGE